MEENIVILRDWLHQMVLVIQDSSVQAVLSDQILLMWARVEAFALWDTIAQEKQPLHLNVRLALSTMRHMQPSRHSVCHAHLDIFVKVMVTHTQMDHVIKAGTVSGVLMLVDLFQMRIQFSTIPATLHVQYIL